MSKHMTQYILTQKGERLAVIDAAEYDAMTVELDKLRGAGGKGVMKAGNISMIPAEVTNRILSDGDHPIRVFRDWRGLTVRQLGQAVGVSHAYISQIETGKRQGTFELMIKIARALRIDLDALALECKNS
jgi:DNA-binding XRE family transcriptional regulator